jgi:hypothetical protein
MGSSNPKAKENIAEVPNGTYIKQVDNDPQLGKLYIKYVIKGSTVTYQQTTDHSRSSSVQNGKGEVSFQNGKVILKLNGKGYMKPKDGSAKTNTNNLEYMEYDLEVWNRDFKYKK